MSFVNLNGNSYWVDNPQYDSEGNVTNLPPEAYTALAPQTGLVQNESGGYGPTGDFKWEGPATPEGQTFAQWADYLYANGLAGQDYNSGLTRTINDYGWAVPLIAAAGFGGLAAAGAGAAEAGAGAAGAEGAGYTGMSDYMAQAGLGADAGFTPSYASMGDYMSQAGLDSGTFSGSDFQMSSTISAKDALSYANKAKSLASLLSSTGGSKSAIGNNPMQLASILGPATSNNNFIGQIKANQNPFIFTPAGQTTASEGMYDVSGSNLANALRKA